MSPPRVLNPQAVPVSGVDAHLPGIVGDALSPDGLRRRFAWQAERGLWTPELAGDGGSAIALPDMPPPMQAAVLVALVQRDGGMSVLLTRRADHLRDHAGQISFPGGRCEQGDAGATATALREAHEEVGLAPERVQVLGQLPIYQTVTRFAVAPVVALVISPLDLRLDLLLDRFEVAEVFEVPLSFLMNPAHHRRHRFVHEGVEGQFLSMPWRGPGADGIERDYFIWGATAAMLRNLYRFLATI